MNIEKDILKLIENFDGNVSVYAIDEYNNEVKYNQNMIVETASCIKLFILIEYYKQIMNNEITREDIITYNVNNDYVSNGSGIIQYLNNLDLSSKNMIILMMIISDNIATNKMIEYLGYENINNTIKELGFNNTRLNIPKLDFNLYSEVGQTTAYEYAKAYKMIKDKKILTPSMCDEIIDILSKQRKNELLTKKLPLNDLNEIGSDSAFINYIASKSGSLGGDENNTINCRNDGGIISTREGDYIISIFINEFSDFYFYSDNPAILLGSEINKIIFETFKENNGSFK